jgi:hypothetical protein
MLALPFNPPFLSLPLWAKESYYCLFNYAVIRYQMTGGLVNNELERL